jgi:hypothetical protein
VLSLESLDLNLTKLNFPNNVPTNTVSIKDIPIRTTDSTDEAKVVTMDLNEAQVVVVVVVNARLGGL